MTSWHTIKLELGPTPAFPEGSPSRGFALRLPLTVEGAIDEAAHRAHPLLAAVRRFWPNEPDMSGYVVLADGGWVFAFASGGAESEAAFRLERRPIRTGDSLTITEPDGCRLPFLVAALAPLERQPDG